MLSSQRKEFDEKKKDESAYPRDFERWYALDYFRRPSGLKSRRFWVTLSTALVVAGLSALTLVPWAHWMHQAAPVSQAHAKLNNNCASCHDTMCQPLARLFNAGDVLSVSNKTCNDCHAGAIHHAKQAREPACATCHREHQGHDVLATHVADRHCASCHGDLASSIRVGEKTAYHNVITHFNRDHPEFAASALGKKDQAKVKFNHKAHLDLDLDALRFANKKIGRDDIKGSEPKMACADCHQMDDARKYPLPINYDKHCASCHALNAPLIGDFAKELKDAAAQFAKTPLPHREPAIVRAVLRDRLAEFAQANHVVAGKSVSVPRPLPWRPVTDEQWSWAKEQAKKTEEVLFMNRQWQKNEQLGACSHCHIEKDRNAGLPVYYKTEIPPRWHQHSIFDHNSHRAMTCIDCHDKNAAGIKVADSQSTTDILLPTLKSCQECHTGGSNGARNACVECHRYHQR
jgi:hypothetical protein